MCNGQNWSLGQKTLGQNRSKCPRRVKTVLKQVKICSSTSKMDKFSLKSYISVVSKRILILLFIFVAFFKIYGYWNSHLFIYTVSTRFRDKKRTFNRLRISITIFFLLPKQFCIWQKQYLYVAAFPKCQMWHIILLVTCPRSYST